MDKVSNPEIIQWVRAEILPLEAELREWLKKTYRNHTDDVDDLIHDLYGKLLLLPSVSHITRPRAYLYQMARHILIDRVRHVKVVNIDLGFKFDTDEPADNAPSPERVALARVELAWVIGMIGRLPERCRKVFEMRKLHGLSLAETARQLTLSESIVEKETLKGLNLISDMIAHQSRQTKRSPKDSPFPMKVASSHE